MATWTVVGGEAVAQAQSWFSGLTPATVASFLLATVGTYAIGRVAIAAARRRAAKSCLNCETARREVADSADALANLEAKHRRLQQAYDALAKILADANEEDEQTRERLVAKTNELEALKMRYEACQTALREAEAAKKSLSNRLINERQLKRDTVKPDKKPARWTFDASKPAEVTEDVLREKAKLPLPNPWDIVRDVRDAFPPSAHLKKITMPDPRFDIVTPTMTLTDGVPDGVALFSTRPGKPLYPKNQYASYHAGTGELMPPTKLAAPVKTEPTPEKNLLANADEFVAPGHQWRSNVKMVSYMDGGQRVSLKLEYPARSMMDKKLEADCTMTLADLNRDGWWRAYELTGERVECVDGGPVVVKRDYCRIR